MPALPPATDHLLGIHALHAVVVVGNAPIVAEAVSLQRLQL